MKNSEEELSAVEKRNRLASDMKHSITIPKSPRESVSTPNSGLSPSGLGSHNHLLSEIDEEGHSSDTDREDQMLAHKITKAMKLEEQRKAKAEEVKTLERKLSEETRQSEMELLRQKYRNGTRQMTALETQIQKIMTVAKDTPTHSLRITARNTGASLKVPTWVRALFDYKPVGKKKHTWFTYDEIIEILDPDVKVEAPKKTQKMDLASFLTSFEDGDEEKEDVKIMRGRVIGSKPLRVGLFPSNYVKDVQIQTGDFSRPDEKTQKSLLGIVRGQVSKKKRRFMVEGFDLDLSYITPQIIAMGIPASDMSALYRNNLDEVIRFLEHFHKDHFQLYNLCDDRSYPIKKFHNRVVQYGFEDHNPCPFDMMEPFCAHLHKFLEESEQNCAAIHCKAGKGRTGLMISAYLIYNSQHQDSFSALRYFAVKRTKNSKGVTIPSQMRYVDYFRRFLEDKRSGKKKIPRSQKVQLVSMTMEPKPKHMGQGNCWFSIDMFDTMELKGVNQLKQVKNTDKIDVEEGKRIPDAVLKRLVKRFKKAKKLPCEEKENCATWRGEPDMILNDDVRITFQFRKRYSMKKKKLFQLWLNTRFLEPDIKGICKLELHKTQIDKICKDTKHSTVPKEFKMILEFKVVS